jgi:hypothetical protein
MSERARDNQPALEAGGGAATLSAWSGPLVVPTKRVAYWKGSVRPQFQDKRAGTVVGGDRDMSSLPRVSSVVVGPCYKRRPVLLA